MTDSLEQRLLALVNSAKYQPNKPRILAKRLDLDTDGRIELRRLVKKLVKAGKLKYGKNHIIYPSTGTVTDTGRAATKGAERVERRAVDTRRGRSRGLREVDSEEEDSDETDSDEATTSDTTPSGKPKSAPSKHGEKPKPGIVGTFRRTSKGFGFVRPLKTAAAAGRDMDIFISAEDSADAASGDIVRVKISSERNRARNSQGKIVEVLERQTHQFVGTYFETGGGAFVQVDGTLFSQPINVGDPGAKNAKQDDKVVFEMVRFPTYWASGEGVIVEVLGARGEPGIDTLSIIREFNLPEGFPDDVVEDSRARADEFNENEIGDRTDFTTRTVVTIDPVDARDFDDAISLEKNEKGNWVLGVHIADVSYFVKHKSPLDREGPGTRDERVSARPCDPDVAGADLQRAGEPAARPRAVREVGPDGVHAGRGSHLHRTAHRRHPQRPPLHLRRSGRIPSRPRSVAGETHARGA